MGKLRVELGFELNTKVVGIVEFYKFNEEDFRKFKTKFKVKLNFKTGQENRKFLHRIFKTVQDLTVFAHTLITEFMEMFSEKGFQDFIVLLFLK